MELRFQTMNRASILLLVIHQYYIQYMTLEFRGCCGWWQKEARQQKFDIKYPPSNIHVVMFLLCPVPCFFASWCCRIAESYLSFPDSSAPCLLVVPSE